MLANIGKPAPGPPMGYGFQGKVSHHHTWKREQDQMLVKRFLDRTSCAMGRGTLAGLAKRTIITTAAALCSLLTSAAHAQYNPYASFSENFPPEGVELGRGWYRTMGVPTASRCVIGSKVEGKLEHSSLNYKFTEVFSRDQIYKALRINAAARYGVARASAGFAESFEADRSSRTVLAQVSFKKFGTYLMPSDNNRIEIRPDWAKTLSEAARSGDLRKRRKALAEFFSACGDSFVVAIERGAESHLQFTLALSDEERKKQISANASGGVGRFKASLSVGRDLVEKLSKNESAIHLSQVGGPPKLPVKDSEAIAGLQGFAAGVNAENAAPVGVILMPFESLPDFPEELIALRTSPPLITYMAELAEKFDDLAANYRQTVFNRPRYQFPFQKIDKQSDVCKAQTDGDKNDEVCLVAELAAEARLSAGIAQCIRKVVAWCRTNVVCNMESIPTDHEASTCLRSDALLTRVNEAEPATGERPLSKVEKEGFVGRLVSALSGTSREAGTKSEVDQKTVAMDRHAVTTLYLEKLARLPLQTVKSNGVETGDIADAKAVCVLFSDRADLCQSDLANASAEAKLAMSEGVRQWVLNTRFARTISAACSIDPDHPLCETVDQAVQVARSAVPQFTPPRRFAGSTVAAPAQVIVPTTVVVEKKKPERTFPPCKGISCDRN
ncbi:hypothetical protein [Rubrivivax rivuli]|uniref:Uncharacterized protein n=1 Tax=Rubrivivax rivuli TaxID=1862385 RepID=A0A437RH32_9BURK|nr:hypothetical protein [Rubrivivax rivuli]RVU46015.1 hypothetical protein EOE66_09065 [Rubrivivax rivuli]